MMRAHRTSQLREQVNSYGIEKLGYIKKSFRPLKEMGNAILDSLFRKSQEK